MDIFEAHFFTQCRNKTLSLGWYNKLLSHVDDKAKYGKLILQIDKQWKKGHTMQQTPFKGWKDELQAIINNNNDKIANGKIASAKTQADRATLLSILQKSKPTQNITAPTR